MHAVASAHSPANSPSLGAVPDRALRTPAQWATFAGIAVVAVVLSHWLDEPAWRLLRNERIYENDFGRLLRLVGYLPTWLIVAGACWLTDKGRAGWGWRGGLIILAPTAGGALAETLKMFVRRLRPDATTFGYAFRPYSDSFISTRGLGMPSSHAMVAFAAAAAMARIFPRTWWIWYLLATGCAITRVMALGHFVSDTVAAAFVGYAVGVMLTRTGGFARALPSAVSTAPAD